MAALTALDRLHPQHETTMDADLDLLFVSVCCTADRVSPLAGHDALLAPRRDPGRRLLAKPLAPLLVSDCIWLCSVASCRGRVCFGER